MCSPTIALSVFTTALSFIGESQQAKAQENAYRQNQLLLLSDLNAQSREADENANAEKSDIAIEALRRKGQVRVASGENLGRGNVVDLLLQDVYAQEGREVTRVETGRKRTQEQINRDKRGVRSRTSSGINSIRQPSLIGAGLQIAGQVVKELPDKKEKKTGK